MMLYTKAVFSPNFLAHSFLGGENQILTKKIIINTVSDTTSERQNATIRLSFRISTHMLGKFQ
jgi:hypothetical protein